MMIMLMIMLMLMSTSRTTSHARIDWPNLKKKKNVGGTFCIGFTLIPKNHKNQEGQNEGPNTFTYEYFEGFLNGYQGAYLCPENHVWNGIP